MKPNKPPTGDEPRDVVEQPWVRSVVARVARQIREEDATRAAATDESRQPKTNDEQPGRR
jgi:hypothetical protein